MKWTPKHLGTTLSYYFSTQILSKASSFTYMSWKREGISVKDADR